METVLIRKLVQRKRPAELPGWVMAACPRWRAATKSATRRTVPRHQPGKGQCPQPTAPISSIFPTILLGAIRSGLLDGPATAYFENRKDVSAAYLRARRPLPVSPHDLAQSIVDGKLVRICKWSLLTTPFTTRISSASHVSRSKSRPRSASSQISTM